MCIAIYNACHTQPCVVIVHQELCELCIVLYSKLCCTWGERRRGRTVVQLKVLSEIATVDWVAGAELLGRIHATSMFNSCSMFLPGYVH